MFDMFLGIHGYIFNHNSQYLRFPNHKIEVFKCTSPFGKKNRTQESDFSTNKLKMSYATARTLCSYHLDNRELYFDLIASLLSHFTFITKNGQDYLKIFESRYDRLRDFSKTTRIGQLAQGVNYLFTQERLDYPYIMDFHLFHKQVYGSLFSGRKSPDFFALKEDFSEIGLMESKGEGAQRSGVTGKLKSAKIQLESVVKPCVETLIPICVRFEYETTSKKSSINYAIINKVCDPKDDFKLRVLRMHYASWFYLVGDFERVDQLLSPEGFSSLDDDPAYTLDSSDKENPIYWVESFLGLRLLSEIKVYDDIIDIDGMSIGIYKNVINRILNNNVNEQTNFPTESDTEFTRFKDGTIIKIKNI